MNTSTNPISAHTSKENFNAPALLAAAPKLEIPTAEEIFDRAPDPITPINYPDSPAWQIADQECARLLINAYYGITDDQIDRHARRFGLSFEESEIELRRSSSDF